MSVELNPEIHIDLEKIHKVSSVLVILSSRGMVFDIHSIRQKVTNTYPGSHVYFKTQLLKSLGEPSPTHVDLIIDLTGPNQRESFCLPWKLSKIGKLIVGRNTGWLRKKFYHRLVTEELINHLPTQLLERERLIQKKVFQLAGVPFLDKGENPLPDLGKTIALELPGLQKL